ncbi:MAG: hypothetical protein ACOVSW_16210 [Candidatus Kapaibacteriota bacterium]
MKNTIFQWSCILALICFASPLNLYAQTPRDTTVIIKGKKFAPGVEVYYDSAGVRKRLDTSRVRRIDSRTIESMIPGWLLRVPGQYPITVQNPSPSSGISNSDTLTISQRIVRTDTALWFRFTSNDRYWHEQVGGTTLSPSDSLFLLVSGNPVIEQQNVEAIMYRNGSFKMSIDKLEDPLMNEYVSPNISRVDEPSTNEKIEIDATISPARFRIQRGGSLISDQQVNIASLRPLFDAAAADISQNLGNGDTTNTKILIAMARAEGHSVIPITGQGRYKITINSVPVNLMGLNKPANRNCIIRVNTERNYIESIELRQGATLETAIYHKLRDNSRPENPDYEIIMTEQYYTPPNSTIRMKFIHTRQYQTIQKKNYLIRRPATTR